MNRPHIQSPHYTPLHPGRPLHAHTHTGRSVGRRCPPSSHRNHACVPNATHMQRQTTRLPCLPTPLPHAPHDACYRPQSINPTPVHSSHQQGGRIACETKVPFSNAPNTKSLNRQVYTRTRHTHIHSNALNNTRTRPKSP